MSEYNFDNLSPYDFEVLMRDLLQSAERIKLRSFAPGRDRGIDLHGWESSRPARAVIVQCKHMAHSSWSNIRSSVKKEKAKLDQLRRKPSRYIFAITKPLTAQNIDELYEMLKPYCKSPDDILDIAAIEQLLTQNEPVVQKHYKLWITSTPILQRVIQAGIYNRSESYRDDLLQLSRTFVQPAAFEKARQILKNHHTCIISGPPGVGKTTLAKMLCLEYLVQGFELIVISEDVLEGDNIYIRDRKQVFIYDDFLGRTDIREKLGKNEDSRIVEFIRRVHRSINHRFILTTREYILRSAQQVYERLDTGNVNVLKCIVEMNNYTQFQKGLILYQHLAFSKGIAREDMDDLVRRKLYYKIVDHRNYTPRHITDALDDIRNRKKQENGKMSLADQLLAVLNDPTHMWSHALRELSLDSRRLFLTLPLLPQPASIDNLQNAYTKQLSNKSEPFLDSLRALEDSFISINASSWPGRRWVRFKNPSLEDFAHAYLNQYHDWLDGLLSAPIYYEQIACVYQLAMSRRATTKSGEPSWRVPLNERPVTYIGIHSWVASRHQELLAKAIDLARRYASQDMLHNGVSEPVVRLKELLDIIMLFGEPSDPKAKDALTELVEAALRPFRESSAKEIFDLLKARDTGQIIERYSTGKPTETLRAGILDEGIWKYKLLSQIDDYLGVSWAKSMMDWGDDYVEYTDQVVLSLSDSVDAYSIRTAIDELQGINNVLMTNIYNSISTLQERLHSLPREVEEGLGIFEDYKPGSASAGYADSLRQLDNVFSSLLI